LDWKSHKILCKKQNLQTSDQNKNNEDTEKTNEITNLSSQISATSITSTPPPAITSTKTMAEMKAEREAKLSAAANQNNDSHMNNNLNNKTSSAAASSNNNGSHEIDISSQPVWATLLWSKIQSLYQSADALLESNINDNIYQAIGLLTQSLHIHAALPAEYPKSVLKNLYSYRSIAFLSLTPPLSHLAVYDAITSLKCDRDYIHSYGVIYNAWKKFGNFTKARGAAEAGLKAANERKLPALAKRFELMMENIDVIINKEKEKLNHNNKTQNPAFNKLNKEKIENSLLSSSLYHLPSAQSLKSLPFLFPSISLSWESQQSYWTSATEGKNIEVSYNSLLGRHLFSSREFKSGSIVLVEKPIVSGCYVEDVCVNCWKTLEKENNNIIINVVYCQNNCKHEVYCSIQCRDEHSSQHLPLCGHSWRDLRERVNEISDHAVGNNWLLVASMIGMIINQIKKHEKEIRAEGIKMALTTKNNNTDNNNNQNNILKDKLNVPVSMIERISQLSMLFTHYELPSTFLSATNQDFDHIWPMTTLLQHWFITTPTTKANDNSNNIITNQSNDSNNNKDNKTNNMLEPDYSSSSSLSYLPYIDYSLIEQFYLKCLLNSHLLHSTPETPESNQFKSCFIAIGLLSSLFTHSCFPSLSLVSDGQRSLGKLIFVANRNIKKNEIFTISYLDKKTLQLDRITRQKALIPYGFICDCSRCKREKLNEKQQLELNELRQLIVKE